MPDQANNRIETDGSSGIVPHSNQISFPLADLNAAVEAAKIFKKQGSDVCELAKFKELVIPGIPDGSNSREIEAAELFGFIDIRDEFVFLTPLGKSVMDPAEAAAARVKAFLAVPLYAQLYDRYKEAILPNIKEMDYELGRLGVPAGLRESVRTVFHRSAMFAGFFSVGAHRLVMPVLRSSPPVPPRTRSLPSLSIGGVVPRPASVAKAPPEVPHPMVQALIASLPAPGSVWTLDQRRKWLQSAAVNFDYLYQSADAESGSLHITIDR